MSTESVGGSSRPPESAEPQAPSNVVPFSTLKARMRERALEKQQEALAKIPPTEILKGVSGPLERSQSATVSPMINIRAEVPQEFTEDLNRIERFGVKDGPRVLQVLFRDGASNGERKSFLDELGEQVDQFGAGLKHSLQSYSARIHQERPMTVQPEKKVSIEMITISDALERSSVWTGHLIKDVNQDPSAGEATLRQVLEELMIKQVELHGHTSIVGSLIAFFKGRRSR